MKRAILSIFATIMVVSIYAQDTLSIDSIQWVSQANLTACMDESRYDGDTVVISGICTVDGMEYGSSSHNIHISQSSKPSPFGSIRFRQGDPNATYNESIRNLVQGDSIIAIGTLSQYQGETQFEPLETNGSISILNRGVAVMDTVIAVSDFNDASLVNNLNDGEQWESAFVTIKDVTVSAVDPFSGNRISFVVEDKNGNKMTIGDHFTAQRLPQYTHPVTNQPGSFVAPSNGDNFASISGIIVHSRSCTGENGRGYQLMPFDASHYVYGPSAPRVENIKQNFNTPTSNQDVTVSADIFDLDGNIVSADLFYNTGTDLTNTSFTRVPMVKGTGNNYSADIPKQADATFVRYYISAEDDSTNTVYRPNTDPAVESFSYRVRDNGLTIFDVQYTPFSNGKSVFEGKEVTVSGVVTASGKDGDLSLVHIQDPNIIGGWSGILLVNTGQTFDRDSMITVTGTVSEQANGSNSFRTTLSNISQISKSGTGSISPMYVDADSFSTYDVSKLEKYESVLVGLINKGGKLHVVDTNPDAPSNFAEYRLGGDKLNPSSGCRVLAGRQGQSSEFVSYVNSSTIIADSASYPVEKIIVSDTLSMDTVVGILSESYYNFKLLPRNNMDFYGANVLPEDTSGSTGPEASIIEFSVNDKIAAFPNPVNDVLNINYSGEAKELTISIIDMNGAVVLTTKLNNSFTSISVNELNDGLYVLQIMNNSGTTISSKRFIKQ